jgi:hypothetical protein
VDDLVEFQKAACYFREFLAKGHKDLGRTGPTCPFVPLALKKDSLYLGVVRTEGPTKRRQAMAAARQFLTRYGQLEPRQGKFEVYKAVLLIFPNCPIEHAHDVIDKVQAELKPEFIKQGLMLGEFHLRNNASGLRNPAFFPLRTPTPCLAIRRIVPSDLVFLDMSKYEAATRRSFLRSYLERFEGEGAEALPAKDRKLVAQAREALEKELAAQQGGGA